MCALVITFFVFKEVFMENKGKYYITTAIVGEIP